MFEEQPNNIFQPEEPPALKIKKARKLPWAPLTPPQTQYEDLEPEPVSPKLHIRYCAEYNASLGSRHRGRQAKFEGSAEGTCLQATSPAPHCTSGSSPRQTPSAPRGKCAFIAHRPHILTHLIEIGSGPVHRETGRNFYGELSCTFFPFTNISITVDRAEATTQSSTCRVRVVLINVPRCSPTRPFTIPSTPSKS